MISFIKVFSFPGRFSSDNSRPRWNVCASEGLLTFSISTLRRSYSNGVNDIWKPAPKPLLLTGPSRPVNQLGETRAEASLPWDTSQTKRRELKPTSRDTSQTKRRGDPFYKCKFMSFCLLYVCLKLPMIANPHKCTNFDRKVNIGMRMKLSMWLHWKYRIYSHVSGITSQRTPRRKLLIDTVIINRCTQVRKEEYDFTYGKRENDC